MRPTPFQVAIAPFGPPRPRAVAAPPHPPARRARARGVTSPINSSFSPLCGFALPFSLTVCPLSFVQESTDDAERTRCTSAVMVFQDRLDETMYTGGSGERQREGPQGPLGVSCIALPCTRTRTRGERAPSASIPLRGRPQQHRHPCGNGNEDDNDL
eukprot:gene14780-biopygen1073